MENWGTLTLVRSTVSNNLAGGPLTSDAEGGGIMSWNGLTLDHSTVTGNRAVVVAPHGRYAEGGGIFMQYETSLTVHASSVSGNTASLTSTNPVTNPDGSSTDMLANSGGIHVSDGSTVAIDSSHIDHNLAVVDNPQGSAGVINAALQLRIQHLTLANTTASSNRAVSRIKRPHWPMGGAWGGATTGRSAGSAVTGNSTVITALDGDAGRARGAGLRAGRATSRAVHDERQRDPQQHDHCAVAPHGDAYVCGGRPLRQRAS